MKNILLAAAIFSAMSLPAFAATDGNMKCSSFTKMSSDKQVAAVHDAMSADHMSTDHMAAGAMSTDHMKSDDKSSSNSMSSEGSMKSDHMKSGDKMTSGDAMSPSAMASDHMSEDAMAMKAAKMCKDDPHSTLGSILKKLL